MTESQTRMLMRQLIVAMYLANEFKNYQLADQLEKQITELRSNGTIP